MAKFSLFHVPELKFTETYYMGFCGVLEYFDLKEIHLPRREWYASFQNTTENI